MYLLLLKEHLCRVYLLLNNKPGISTELPIVHAVTRSTVTRWGSPKTRQLRNCRLICDLRRVSNSFKTVQKLSSTPLWIAEVKIWSVLELRVGGLNWKMEQNVSLFVCIYKVYFSNVSKVFEQNIFLVSLNFSTIFTSLIFC